MSMEQDDELEDEDGYISPANPTVDDFRALEKVNKRLFKRAKKAEGKIKGLDGAAPTVTPTSANTTVDQSKEDAAWRERMELKTDGYSDEEIAYIQQSGGRKALENTYVKATIETMRKQKQAEAATVETGAGKSEVEKKYTDEQLRAMTPAELEKLLPHAQQ